MAQSELIETIQLPDGGQMRKFRAKDGQVSYRRGDGTFLSPDVGKALEKNANRQVGNEDAPKQQATFNVKPRSEEDRKALVESRYPEIDNVSNLNPERPKTANDKMEQVTMSWMDNETLRRQIRQDPLLDSDVERSEALEARARELVEDIQNVKNEEEAMQVLRSYDIY